MNVSNEHYDLIILECISNECFLPLAVAMFDVTFIYMNGVAPVPWLLNAIGSPLASDHFPVRDEFLETNTQFPSQSGLRLSPSLVCYTRGGSDGSKNVEQKLARH
jgi:hypothetical protein